MALNLAGLYEGAALGPSYSTKLGQLAETEQNIDDAVRANLLVTGVATGKINPAGLASRDQSLVSGLIGKPPPLKTESDGGVLGAIGGVLGTGLKVVTNTAQDFAQALEGLPGGLVQTAEATSRTINQIPGLNQIIPSLPSSIVGTKGPNAVDLLKQQGQMTVKDFTHPDLMHPLFPVMDALNIASLGRLSGERLAMGAARLGEEGGALARAGETAKAALRPTGPRPIEGIPQNLGEVSAAPQYSISPTRALFVEKPFDALMNTKFSQIPAPLPGQPEGTTLAELRTAYHLRKIGNVARARLGSFSQAQLANETEGINKAAEDLLKESGYSPAVSQEKYHAMSTIRMLGLWDKDPLQRLEALSQYRERVFMGPAERIEGIADTAERDNVRAYYRNLLNSNEYKNYFMHPTDAMKRMDEEMTNALTKGQEMLGMDPREVLNRTLGPAAHIYNKSPEEMLREEPVAVQAQTNFAIQAHDLEQAIKEAGGNTVEGESLIPRIAGLLPGNASIEAKIKLLQDAVESFKEDLQGNHSRRALNNNQAATGYLQGNNIAQKVSTGLVDRLGVDPDLAQPYAALSGLTQYFPGASAAHMKVVPSGGRIARTMDRMLGKGFKEANRPMLEEYKHGNNIRLLKSQELGIAPYADFLHESDLSLFKAGIDRRDPVAFARHLQQRERLLAHRLVSEPLQERLALDGGRLFGSQPELEEHLGSVQAAQRYRLVPMKALRVLVTSENEAGKEVADVLRGSDGTITPEMSDQIDRIIDETAHDAVRQEGDAAIADKGKMVAMPAPYVNNLIRHAQILDQAKGVGGLWRGFINRWRTAVLAYMPSWFFRTSMGHGLVAFLGGTWNPVHYMQAMNENRFGFKLPGQDVEISRQLEKVPGIEQGSPHTDFEAFGARGTFTNRFAKLNAAGVHRVNNFQRRAAFLATLNKVTRTRMGELEDAMKIPRIMKSENIDYIIKNHPEFVHHALNEMDRITYTFGQMSPWERRLAKNAIPFYGWWKFMNKFIYSLPVTFPGRTLAITRLGQLGQSQLDQLGPMPEWMRSALLLDTRHLMQLRYISMLGLNPLGDVVDPGIGTQGIFRLGQLNPLIQAGLEAGGYNTLTGALEPIDQTSGVIEVNGQYYDLKTGQVAENPGGFLGLDIRRAVGGLATSFPELRIFGQYLAHGHPQYPESIPFPGLLKPMPLAPGSKAKDVTPGALALNFLGVAPRTYNLQRWQQRYLTDMARARTTYYNSLAKQRAQGIIK